MTKAGVVRIFRVAAAFVIAILCVCTFLSRTLTPASHEEQYLNGEDGLGRADDNDDVVARRQIGSLNFRNHEENGDDGGEDLANDDGGGNDSGDVIAKHSNRKSALSKKFGQEEIDFDVRAGGRFSIGSGGDPGFIDLPVSDVLLPDLIPPDVHFLWCGTKWFEFKHYLSVMSVRRMIQPDKIYIHFEQEPGLDRVYYNQASHDPLYIQYLLNCLHPGTSRTSVI